MKRVVRYLTVLALPVSLAGCGVSGAYGCPDPSQACTTSDGGPGIDAGPLVDAGPPPSTCAGPCVAHLPDGWLGPVLVQTGAPDVGASCPPEAPHVDYDGYAALTDEPLACPACTCDAAEGACGASTELTANAAPCASVGDGVQQTPVSVPLTGACTPVGGLPAGAPCATGHCLQSLTFAPLALMETGCAPSAEPPPEPTPPVWQTAALACADDRPGWCDDVDTICAPADAAGFSLCISQAGDLACPSDWPLKQTFYKTVEDTRSCTPCDCGAPTGGTCTALVSAFSDSTCTTTQVALKMSSSVSACVPVQTEGSPPTSPALGGVTGSKPTYQPGTCLPSGGAPSGMLAPAEPTTFCCRP